ncbi:MAG TPA: DUF3568 family protein [Desulfatiglandales bacterium]|nr:DUF3568 family protein [Desulfatiglandales bacterium]
MRNLRYIFLLFLCLCMTGCPPMAFLGGAAAGIGAYKYINEILTVVYEAPFDDTWDASIKALEDMGFTIENQTKELGSGRISTREDEKNKKVNLTLQYKSPQETEVKIRVGLLGDENASNVIKDRIAGFLYKK